MMIDLAELERLEKAATPAPWPLQTASEFLSFGRVADPPREPVKVNTKEPFGIVVAGKCGLLLNLPDAAAIAALRNAAPELLALVREACELLIDHKPAHDMRKNIANCPRCAWEARRGALLARVKLG